MPEPSLEADAVPGGCEAHALADLAIRQLLSVARDASSLLSRDEHAELIRYTGLAERTMRSLPIGMRAVLPLDPRSGSVARLIADRRPAMPSELASDSEWDAWVDSYDALPGRNPRLAMADLLGRMEHVLATTRRSRHNGGPCVRRALEVPRPSRDQTRRLAAVFVDDPLVALANLRREMGGWVIRDEETDIRVFVPDGEVQYV